MSRDLPLLAVVLHMRDVPRIPGNPLSVAGAGYLIDSSGQTVLTNHGDHEVLLTWVVLVPAFIVVETLRIA